MWDTNQYWTYYCQNTDIYPLCLIWLWTWWCLTDTSCRRCVSTEAWGGQHTAQGIRDTSDPPPSSNMTGLFTIHIMILIAQWTDICIYILYTKRWWLLVYKAYINLHYHYQHTHTHTHTQIKPLTELYPQTFHEHMILIMTQWTKRHKDAKLSQCIMHTHTHTNTCHMHTISLSQCCTVLSVSLFVINYIFLKIVCCCCWEQVKQNISWYIWITADFFFGRLILTGIILEMTHIINNIYTHTHMHNHKFARLHTHTQANECILTLSGTSSAHTRDGVEEKENMPSDTAFVCGWLNPDILVDPKQTQKYFVQHLPTQAWF